MLLAIQIQELRNRDILVKCRSVYMYSDKTLMLNNGVEVPRIQLGTWLINNDDVRKVIRQAINVGYRAFDTAKTMAMKVVWEKVFGTLMLSIVIFF